MLEESPRPLSVMTAPFRATPSYRQPRPPAGGELGLSASRLRNISHFEVADAIIDRLQRLAEVEKQGRQIQELPTKQELRSWAQHPNERVPMALAEHFIPPFTQLLSRKKVATLLQQRALQQAEQEGELWTPLLDAYQHRMAFFQEAPDIPELDQRLDQVTDWARQQESTEELEGLLTFDAHLLLVRIAELPFSFEGAEGRAWLQRVTNPENPSAPPLRYEPLLKRLLDNQHLTEKALEAILEAAPSPLNGVQEELWLEFAQHPAATSKHWIYLMQEKETNADVFHSYLPKQAWQHPEVQNIFIEEVKAQAGDVQYQHLLVAKMLRWVEDREQRHRIGRKLFEAPETRRAAFSLLEEGDIDPPALPSRLMTQLLASPEPEIRQKAWELLRQQSRPSSRPPRKR